MQFKPFQIKGMQNFLQPWWKFRCNFRHFKSKKFKMFSNYGGNLNTFLGISDTRILKFSPTVMESVKKGTLLVFKEISLDIMGQEK